MLGSPVIDIAIGLVTLYLLLSTIASFTVEIVMKKLAPRAGLLRDHLHLVFGVAGGGKGAPTDPTLNVLFDHGLMKPLGKDRDPSYIASGAFARAVIDALKVAGQTTPPLIADLRKNAALLPESQARSVLLATFDRVGNDLNAAIVDIESWYNDVMDRISGHYKKNVQRWLLAIGIVLATTLNVDSIAIMRHLAVDSASREALVAAGTKTIKDADAAPDPTGKSVEELRAEVEKAYAVLGKASLPIGWDRPGPDDAAGWLMKLAGLLITAVAVSFGAPFWFDLLNNVTNLRLAGPKPK
jgi:hypothetical protein